MGDRDVINRIIDAAVERFTEDNPPNRDSRFSTAAYMQALNASLGTDCDTSTCIRHLEDMDDVERVDSFMWRRTSTAPYDGMLRDDMADDGPTILSDPAKTMAAILRLLGDGGWHSAAELTGVLGGVVLSDMGDDLEAYFSEYVGGIDLEDAEDDAGAVSIVDELLEMDGDMDRFKEFVLRGADDGSNAIVAGFVDYALYRLRMGGEVVQLRTPPGDDRMFSLAGRGDVVVASGPGDACECGSVIGADGRCHDCRAALFGPEAPPVPAQRQEGACGCGGLVCEHGYCGRCGDGLADTGDGLGFRDWAEIYYALGEAWRSIEDDHADTPEFAENWRRHIRTIMAKIGCDGRDMVRGESP